MPRWTVLTIWAGLSLWPAIRAEDVTPLRQRPPAPPGVQRICPLVVSPENVRPHVEYLASEELAGRRGDGGFQAGEYVALKLKEAGAEPLFDGDYFQPIPGAALPNGEIPIIGRNVGAVIRGSDPRLQHEYILIGAHYDHLGRRGGVIHPGADDNASGVAMLLEAGRYFSQRTQRSRRSIALVAFDLEEELLYGSRWYAAHPAVPLSQTRVMIAADMISRSLGNLPLPAVFVLGSEHAPELREHLTHVGVPQGLQVARLGVDFVGTRSDYGPFRDRGVPFLFFSTGEHPDYHTQQDTADRADYEKLARVTSLILRLVERLSNTPHPATWAADSPPDMEEPQVMLRITQLLLQEEAAGRMKLSPTTRFIANQTLAKVGYIVQRGTISRDERAWLRRSAQYLLISAF